MSKPQNNKTTKGKQKTKYNKKSEYFCYNTIKRWLLAANFFLSFSSLQHKLLRQ